VGVTVGKAVGDFDGEDGFSVGDLVGDVGAAVGGTVGDLVLSGNTLPQLVMTIDTT